MIKRMVVKYYELTEDEWWDTTAPAEPGDFCKAVLKDARQCCLPIVEVDIALLRKAEVTLTSVN